METVIPKPPFQVSSVLLVLFQFVGSAPFCQPPSKPFMVVSCFSFGLLINVRDDFYILCEWNINNTHYQRTGKFSERFAG